MLRRWCHRWTQSLFGSFPFVIASLACNLSWTEKKLKRMRPKESKIRLFFFVVTLNLLREYTIAMQLLLSECRPNRFAVVQVSFRLNFQLQSPARRQHIYSTLGLAPERPRPRPNPINGDDYYCVCNVKLLPAARQQTRLHFGHGYKALSCR